MVVWGAEIALGSAPRAIFQDYTMWLLGAVLERQSESSFFVFQPAQHFVNIRQIVFIQCCKSFALYSKSCQSFGFFIFKHQMSFWIFIF